jgi:nucleotide-binding universal stress UspA family protein
MFKTVVVGADSSVTASRAVSTAVELVKAVGGSLHVITAYKPEPTQVDKLPTSSSTASPTPPTFCSSSCAPASPRRA